MATYIVSIPIAGSIAIEVEADSERVAIETAWAAIDAKGEEAGELSWEFMEQVTWGNVCYAPLNEIEVEEV